MFWADELRRADSHLEGRVTHELIAGVWRRPDSGVWCDWMGGVVDAVIHLRNQSGRGIALGGVKLPAAHGLLGEYTFVVHPVVAGRSPRPLDGIKSDSARARRATRVPRRHDRAALSALRLTMAVR